MDDADIKALAEQVGLTAPIGEVVAWARQRTDDVLGGGLDADLAALLEGRPVAVDPARLVARPARTETQPSAPRPEDPDALTRLPLPPVPQRPDLAARLPHLGHAPGDSADDLEMLDEDDLELVEELADGADGDAGPATSSPEWKRALADAQGE